jgi:hypothetical protein
MRKFILCTVSLLGCVFYSDAQAQFLDPLNMPMYHARVKLVDEFFARFNGKEKRTDLPQEYSDRKSNILMLFDLSQFQTKHDSLFLEADSFAQKVAQDSILLDYSDDRWYAKVHCFGQLAKKKVDFYLYLVVESRGNDMYKWAIANAEGDIFNTSRSREHIELFMLPNAHEQSFSSLSRVTSEDARYIDDYVKDGYEASPLSVFLTLVRSGLLQIEYTSEAEFVFFQVPNYIFTVRHFERDSMNVGWLISSIVKCEEEHKKDKKELLNAIRK